MGYIEKNLLEEQPEYNLIYQRLLKEARVWNNSGQYWLGAESMRKAKQLLNGDISECNVPNKSENLFYNKHTMKIGNNYIE